MEKTIGASPKQDLSSVSKFVPNEMSSIGDNLRKKKVPLIGLNYWYFCNAKELFGGIVCPGKKRLLFFDFHPIRGGTKNGG